MLFFFFFCIILCYYLLLFPFSILSKIDLRIFGYVDSKNQLYIQKHGGIRTCKIEWNTNSIERNAQLTNTSLQGTMCSTQEHWPWEHIHDWNSCRSNLVSWNVSKIWASILNSVPGYHFFFFFWHFFLSFSIYFFKPMYNWLVNYISSALSMYNRLSH